MNWPQVFPRFHLSQLKWRPLPLSARGFILRGFPLHKITLSSRSPKVDLFRYAICQAYFVDEITEALAHRRESILEPYLSESWRADFWHDSPVILDFPVAGDAHLMVRGLYRPEDVLWIGGQFDSGKPQHEANFRTTTEWIELETLPPRIASGTFKQGSISRSDSNLISSPFIVIESDDLIGHKPDDDVEREWNKRLCAALILLCRDRLKLSLRAVIDTGGKSLHGWFDRPSPDAVEALMSIAQGLAIDDAVVTRASNPLRLPGCIHQKTSKPARLLYLNAKTF